jgi:DNA polymerase III alpha subunit
MKIVSVKSLGVSKTYSPEMLSHTHNYITDSSVAVHANSHGVSYCLVAYRCLWLKAHFAPEWWSAVMSDCHPDKRVRYMSVARTEAWHPTDITYSGHHKPKEPARGVKFDTINISNLTKDFTVVGDVVNQGLISISGLGESACEIYAGSKDYNSIEEFIAPVASDDQNGGKSRANKIALERFIKLGAFKHLPGHKNAKALWIWYQYHHCSGKEMTALRREIKQKLLDHQGWTEERIKKEIVTLSAQFKDLYPKKKLPKKITDFKPEPDESLKAFNDIITEGFSLSEVLSFQKDYLGYYVNNPLDMYDLEDGMDIQNAKRKIMAGLFRSTKISVFVTEYVEAITRTGNPYAKVSISDGVSRALVMIWNTELEKNKSIQTDMAYKMYVEYDQSRSIFTLAKNSTVKRLNTVEDKQ